MLSRGNLTKGQFILTRIILFLTIIIVIVPLLWIFSISLKRPDEMYMSYLFFFPRHLSVENYGIAVKYLTEFLEISIPRMFLNSLIVTISSIIIAIIVASLAGFGFSNYIFKGKELLFLMVLGILMIPQYALIIPLYLLFSKIKLLGTYYSLVFAYVTFNLPFSIFVLRGFFEQVPLELRDAARIDGSSDFYYFLRVVLPISRPGIATVSIFAFLEFWNEFLFAFLFIRDYKMQTIPAVLARMGGGKVPIPFGVYTATIMVVIIPLIIFFVISQRWFISGLAAGALKE
ncbi:MAG: carbohydrate ABC transporter permease [Actinobacteria bacterium]|nr:carbohydrate ABC transporter permease [Actinomycetota bacterium]MCL5771408.1 carbohydrate ABC transporter permease [Actinomycetota bacterium]